MLPHAQKNNLILIQFFLLIEHAYPINFRGIRISQEDNLMKKLLFLLPLTTTIAHASSDPMLWPASIMGHNEDSRCITSEDPFDVPAYVFATPNRFSNGTFTISFPNTEHPEDLGRCVNRSHYRPVLSLSEAGQEQFGMYEDPNYVVVANVRHFDKFYVARVPVKQISQMNFLVSISKMSVLGVRGGHAEMRVYFSQPVRLIQQWPYNPNESFTVSELMFTGNPNGAELKDRLDPLKNFDGSLLHARGIHTIETRLKDSFVDSDVVAEHQYRMLMNSAESEAYVRKYIKLANSQRLGRHFVLTDLNCNYTQFEVLDDVLKNRYSAPRTPFDPDKALENLNARNLVDQNFALPDFQDEDFSKNLIKQLKAGK